MSQENEEVGNGSIIVVAVGGLAIVSGERILAFIKFLWEVVVMTLILIIKIAAVLAAVALVGFIVWSIYRFVRLISWMKETIIKLEDRVEKYEKKFQSEESRVWHVHYNIDERINDVCKEVNTLKSHTGLEAKESVTQAADKFIEWA